MAKSRKRTSPRTGRSPASKVKKADRLVDTATQHHRAGNMAEAKRYYRQALNAAPEHGGAAYYLCGLLMDEGRNEEGLGVLEETAEHDPPHTGFWNNLGNLRRKHGDLAGAARAYSRALRLDPGHVNALFNAATTARELDDLGGTIPYLEKLLALRPEDAGAWVCLGEAKAGTGDGQGAIQAYGKALELQPDDVTTHNNIGIEYKNTGEFDRALEHLEKALTGDRTQVQGCLNISAAKRFQSHDDPLIALIRAKANQPLLSNADRALPEFALGKIYNDLKDYDRAFKHFSRANRLKKSSTYFDHGKRRGITDRLITVFSPRFFEAGRTFGDPSDRPVFIVGMPRSGTTLVEQILASHELVFGGDELTWIGDIAMALGRSHSVSEPFPESARHLTDKSSAQLAERYLRQLDSLSTHARYVTDKLPGNFLYLGVIASLFPNAKIIHCRRNPMDVCLSIYFQWFTDGHEYAYDLSDIALQFHEYRRLMTHWHEVLPIEILAIDYESVVDEQEETSRKLIEFVGLPWQEQMLNFEKAARSVQTASNWQVRQPIYTTAKRRWKHYERHLDELKEALGVV